MRFNVSQIALLKLLKQKLSHSNGVHLKALNSLIFENYQSADNLQKTTGLKAKQVKQILRQLESKKLIKKEGRLYSIPKFEEIMKLIK